MAKHRKRQHGGGGTTSSSSASSSSFVVVNPALLQSLGRSQSTPSTLTCHSDSNKKQPNKKQNQTPRQQQQKRVASASNDQKPPKKKAKLNHSQQHHQDAPPSAAAIDASATPPYASYYQLVLKKQQDLVMGVYWILLSLATKASVVVLPNQHPQLTPSLVCNTLRHLGFARIAAIHAKMSATQRKEMISRYQQQDKEPNDQTLVQVLVTTEHFASSVVNHPCSKSCALIAVQLDGDNNTTPKYFAAMQSVYAVGVDYMPRWQAFPTELTALVAPKLYQRVKVARQIAQISEETKSMNAAKGSDPTAKWVNRFAQEAGLDRLEDESASTMPQRISKALTPQEQRLKSLGERLCLLLAEPLPGVAGTGTGKGTGSRATAATAATAAKSAPHNNSNTRSLDDLHEKLEFLGIVTINASAGSCLSDQRLSAQTQWMDQASGVQFGGHWDGPVRHGATKDETSLQIRAKYFGASNGTCHDHHHHHRNKCTWKPNAKPDDRDTWGGPFGKACGHNEVVMHALRPFFPQEVLNSRICSRKNPAPGNSGFDGCLEFLQWSCKQEQQRMTIWDAEHFVLVDDLGRVVACKKNQLLTLSLPCVRVVVNNMRLLTLENVGTGRQQQPASQVFEKLQLICRIGLGTVSLQSTNATRRGGSNATKAQDQTSASCLTVPKILRRIASFLVHGNTRQWKQIVKAPALEETISE